MLGSEPPPGAGSVMANDERTLPSTIGFSHFSFCAGVPSFFSTFMLPSSGAMQLNASGPNSERAASSYITAQATIGRSMPPYSFGDCGAQRPAFFAFSRTGVEPRVRDVLVLGEIHRIGFERQHVLLDEGAGAHAKVFDLGRQREVHDFPYPRSATIWPPSQTIVAPAM